MDGPFAVQRIMDSLDHSDLPELPFSIVPSVGRDVYEGLGHWLQYERGAFARDRGRSQRVRDKVTGYRRGELSKLLGTMKRVTGRFTDVRIARIEAGLYCVYC